MKYLSIRVIIMMIGVNFTGTMTTPSRKSSIFPNSECQRNGYPWTNCSFTGKHDIPVNVPQKENSMDISSNFFRVLLQSPMEKKEQNIKRAVLRNNPGLKITLSPLVHLHALEILNLSNNALHSVDLDLSSPESSAVKRHGSSLRHGFPFLKVLILQRNKLSDVPKGLWKLKSLQSLDLSFNEISKIALSDFHNCLQLENLYLNNNKIFRVFPEAFKSLKKLKVVDLSHNALVTVLPMMLIALELPHLEIDLTGNQWQCDCSVAVFQNVLSESWRQKWKGICSRSTGNAEACWGTSPRRIPRETPMSVDLTKTEHPAEGLQQGANPAGAPSRELELHSRWTRGAGSAGVAREPRSSDSDSSDLALAVSLSVLITFVLAFGLGALARPYLERLLCRRRRAERKKPPPDLAYSNEGYYDEIGGSIRQNPRPDGLAGAYSRSPPKNQNPFPGMDAYQDVGIPESRGRRVREGGVLPAAAAGSKTQEAPLAKDSAGPGALHEGARGGPDASISAAQERTPRRVSSGETIYDTVALEESPKERPAGPVQAASNSLPVKWREVNSAALSREPAVAVCAGRRQGEAPRTGQSGPGGNTELPAGAAQEPVYLNLQNARQQQGPPPSGAGLAPSPYYSSITDNDVGDATPSPPLRPPRRGSAQGTVPANPEPAQRPVTPGTQCDVSINYDSDEGSLFTLSSTDSEDARCEGRDETDQKERSRASEEEDFQVRKDLESQEDHAYQVTLWGAENHEGSLENPSHPDSNLSGAQVESACDTDAGEQPGTLLRSQHHSPVREVTPDQLPAPASDTAVWRYSLKDLGEEPWTPLRSRDHSSVCEVTPDRLPAPASDAAAWRYSLKDLGEEPRTLLRSRDHSPVREVTPNRLPAPASDAAAWRSSLKDLGEEPRTLLRSRDHSPVREVTPNRLPAPASDAAAWRSSLKDLGEEPRTLLRSRDHSPVREVTPDRLPAPASDAAAWRYSLKDLGEEPRTLLRSRDHSPVREVTPDRLPAPASDAAAWCSSLKDLGEEPRTLLRSRDHSPVREVTPDRLPAPASDAAAWCSSLKDLGEEPRTLLRSRDHSPVREVTPDRLPAPASDAAAWRYSLKDLGEEPRTLLRSRDHSPVREVTPDRLPAPASDAAAWRYSLKDLGKEPRTLLRSRDHSPVREVTPDRLPASASDTAAWHYSLKDLGEEPRTLLRSWDHSPVREVTPDWLSASASDTAAWHYSLKDLVCSDGNPAPKSPLPRFADGPSESNLSTPQGRGPEAFQYELNTVPYHRTFKITWDSLGSSQLTFEEGADTKEEFV